jgi:cardiolipin synthase (CMP-forming)
VPLAWSVLISTAYLDCHTSFLDLSGNLLQIDKLTDWQLSSQGQPTSSKPTLKQRLLPLTPHENIYTLPNILTASRLIAAPAIGYLVLHDMHAWALGLFAYAGITDLVDGWIARRWELQTVVGSVVDPMADKVLMTVLTVALAVKGAMPGTLS